MTPRIVRSRAGFVASTPAACRTSASFMSSEGWNCSGPAPSQRCAPLIETPTPGTFTATSSANEMASSAGVRRGSSSSPPRASTCSTTSPIAPYARYLTRYIVPSPWPSSSVRADDDAVDHDGPGRQQAERGRQQDVVLDGLGLPAGLRRSLGTSLGGDSHRLSRSTPAPRSLANGIVDGCLDAPLDGWSKRPATGRTVMSATGPPDGDDPASLTETHRSRRSTCPLSAPARCLARGDSR